VNVRNSVVNGNKANGTVLGQGGGIFNTGGVLTLVGTKVQGNKATTGSDNIFAGP
jgi:hypothetical protein